MVTIKGATREQIGIALMHTNCLFEDNIIFKKFQPFGKNYTVTLTVKDSRKPGSRISFSGHRISAACWHVYGVFFDEILKQSTSAIIISNGQKITKEYGNWIDRNIGSIMEPMMYSEACNCEGGFNGRN